MNTLYQQNRSTGEERNPWYFLEREIRIRGFSRDTVSAYLYYNKDLTNFAIFSSFL